jgi:hypothetical protein
VAADLARPTTSAAPRGRGRGARGPRDAGYILVSTLVKLVVTLAIVGTAGYDAFSLMATHIQVEDHASQAASIGHDKLKKTKSAQAAYAEIVKFAEEHGETVVPDSFRVGPKRSVTVTLTKTASTIAASHIPGLKNYVVAVATSTSTDPLA